MTAAEGAQILQHMASMAWTKMRGCAQQIAEKALGVCKTLIPKEKEQIPITERHLVIWFVLITFKQSWFYILFFFSISVFNEYIYVAHL